MTMTRGKYIIGSLWGIGFLVLFILMTVQSVYVVYEDRTQEAWEWFTPNILPTIGLIVGIFIVDWANPAPTAAELSNPVQINPLLVGVTFIFSLTHLAILLIIILIAANKAPVTEIFSSLKSANLPLGAIQGLVTLTLGIFFKKI